MVEIVRLEKNDKKPIELSESDFALYLVYKELIEAINKLMKASSLKIK